MYKRQLDKARLAGDRRDDDLLITEHFYYQVEKHGTGNTYIFIVDYKNLKEMCIRDRNTQYIAKKALSMLNEICRRVVATTGAITDELREDWQLVDVMNCLLYTSNGE